MTSVEIETFLAICRHKSISKAAEEMIISQSTLSMRLKAMEERLGCPLLLRSKGNREITLTTWGQAFYDLALQYQEITRKMESLNRSILVESLNIAAIHSVGAHLLLPAVERFSRKYPQIHLTVQDMWAELACAGLISGKIDLVFSTSKIETAQIVASPFLTDPMVFLCSSASDYPETVELDMLSADSEVYTLWSAEIEHWHHNTFGSETLPSLHVEFEEQIARFCAEYGKWAIVPQSVAKDLAASYPVRQCRTAFPIPARSVYILRSRDRAGSDNILRFLDTLREVLSESRTAGLLL